MGNEGAWRGENKRQRQTVGWATDTRMEGTLRDENEVRQAPEKERKRERG